MTKNNSKDLTVGSPTGLILGFSLPLLLGMLFQQVYSLMDMAIPHNIPKYAFLLIPETPHTVLAESANRRAIASRMS